MRWGVVEDGTMLTCACAVWQRARCRAWLLEGIVQNLTAARGWRARKVRESKRSRCFELFHLFFGDVGSIPCQDLVGQRGIDRLYLDRQGVQVPPDLLDLIDNATKPHRQH